MQNYDDTDTARRPRARPISSAVSIPFVFLFFLCPFTCPNPPMSIQVHVTVNTGDRKGRVLALRSLTDWRRSAVQHGYCQFDDSRRVARAVNFGAEV